MPQALAEFEGRGKTLDGKLAFAQPPMGQSAEVKTIGLSPGVLAIRLVRPVKRIAGVLESLAGVCRGEIRFGQGEAEVDGVFAEAASVRQENARFGFENRFWIIPQMPVEFAGRLEATELVFDYAGVVGEGAGVLKVTFGLGGIVRKEEPGEEGVAPAKFADVVGTDHALPVGQHLATCSGPVAAKELELGLPGAETAE
jgi:hypothetical protein